MNTEKQAQQLRLAADILETGHPFEYDNGEGWFRPPHGNPLWPISNRREIRLALATPPDGRPLHNPDNFTAEQVGVGYRLLLKEEVDFENHDGSEFRSALNLTHTWKPGRWRWDRASSIRLPLSVPWPEAPKPEPPPFQLPPCAPGKQWHRMDGWKEGDLPPGTRPHALGEVGDGEGKCLESGKWHHLSTRAAAKPEHTHLRTTCPLTFEHAGKQWTWHRPGDPMPCEEAEKLQVIYKTSHKVSNTQQASWFAWTDVLGWRYADPETVPLGPEDVHPHARFRGKTSYKPNHTPWITPLCVNRKGLVIASPSTVIEVSWPSLRDDYERNESLSTGKWNPDAWEPCHKPAP